jgi:hypothetical protein
MEYQGTYLITTDDETTGSTYFTYQQVPVHYSRNSTKVVFFCRAPVVFYSGQVNTVRYPSLA